MLTLEKQRVTKERIFYLNEGNELKYEQALKKAANLEEDLLDNLTKMSRHILGFPSSKLLDLQGKTGAVEPDEEQGIGERVSRNAAEKLLESWKQMKIEAEQSSATAGQNSESLLLEETKIKDRLFVEHGEDVDDAFAAFRYYGLDSNITENDRKRLGKQ